MPAIPSPPDLDPLTLFLLLAAGAAILLAEALYLVLRDAKRYRAGINRRLELGGGEGGAAGALVRLRRERGLGADGRLGGAAFRRLLVQSGLRLRPARLALGLGTLGLVAFGGVLVRCDSLGLAALAALLAVTVPPFLGLVVMRRRRRHAFAVQFPSAIDIIVRSLRAGHPVPTAVAMVAREMPDPIGSEFGLVADEITYGSDLEAALRAMMARVGQEDLPLFVTSVAIQASTGGNLSQILENLSRVVRERFKMRRKVRGISAEGRMSAMILNALPVFVIAITGFMAPGYYGEVIDVPMTRFGLGVGAAWMFVGNLVMRRMINFRI